MNCEEYLFTRMPTLVAIDSKTAEGKDHEPDIALHQMLPDLFTYAPAKLPTGFVVGQRNTNHPDFGSTQRQSGSKAEITGQSSVEAKPASLKSPVTLYNDTEVQTDKIMATSKAQNTILPILETTEAFIQTDTEDMSLQIISLEKDNLELLQAIDELRIRDLAVTKEIAALREALDKSHDAETNLANSQKQLETQRTSSAEIIHANKILEQDLAKFMNMVKSMTDSQEDLLRANEDKTTTLQHTMEALGQAHEENRKLKVRAEEILRLEIEQEETNQRYTREINDYRQIISASSKQLADLQNHTSELAIAHSREIQELHASHRSQENKIREEAKSYHDDSLHRIEAKYSQDIAELRDRLGTSDQEQMRIREELNTSRNSHRLEIADLITKLRVQEKKNKTKNDNECRRLKSNLEDLQAQISADKQINKDLTEKLEATEKMSFEKAREMEVLMSMSLMNVTELYSTYCHNYVSVYLPCPSSIKI